MYVCEGVNPSRVGVLSLSACLSVFYFVCLWLVVVLLLVLKHCRPPVSWRSSSTGTSGRSGAFGSLRHFMFEAAVLVPSQVTAVDDWLPLLVGRCSTMPALAVSQSVSEI